MLTLDNLANRGQFLNAANTFEELLNYGVIPVVNENDTVAVEQLRIGDNDTLSAQVATLVQAKWLFLLTDVDALYTSNPNSDPNAKPIHQVEDIWSLQVDTSTRGTQWGTGGMATKLTAARIAVASGCNMGICHFNKPGNILAMLRGEKIGTVFHAAKAPVKGKKRWVLSVPVKGEVWLDPGAVRAVRDRRCSLFSPGVVHVEGDFEPHDAVRICDQEGREFGRGLINYARDDVDRVKGMSSRNCIVALGTQFGEEEIVHRANLCLLVQKSFKLGPGVTLDDEHELDEEDEVHDDDWMSPAGLSRSQTPGVGFEAAGGGGIDGIYGRVAEEDVRARLAMLTARVEAEEVNWRSEAAAAAAEEAAEAAAAAHRQEELSKEDVNEAGWLPK